MLWATTRAHPTWFYDWDAVRSSIVHADSIRGMEPLDLDAQYALAARVIAASARRTVDAGVDCAVVGHWVPSSVAAEYAHTWDDLDALDPLIVVLLPRVEVCVARNAGDAARRGPFAVTPEQVEYWHPLHAAWRDEPRAVVVDTSDMTRAAVVSAIEDLVSP